MKEISLRPYTGKLFYVRTKKEYEQAHIDLFKEPDILSCSNGGRFSGGCGKDNYWTYLIWAKSTAFLAHELVHILVHVFERSGLNINDSGGEAFAYMLQTLMQDIQSRK